MTEPIRTRPVLGIFGGMGPVASAAFLTTLYEAASFGREQDAPACILLSDPCVPDRTEAMREGQEEEVLLHFVDAVERLERAGATRVVAACVSIHHWIPSLPAPLQERLISLVDVIIDEVGAAGTKSLLLCSSGARAARIFERHPRWSSVAELVVLPDAADQAQVHAWIFEIKKHRLPHGTVQGFCDLVAKYGAQSLIAGCSELHILAKALRAHPGAPPVIDPLETIARDPARFLEVCGAA